jgi:hypothetical protein
MIMKVRVLLVVLALILVTASSGLAAAADQAVVPFRAKYVTNPQTVGMSNGVLQIAIPAEGKATYLGRSTWYALMWVDTTQDPWTQGSDEMTFVAANGDKLVGTYAGFAEPTGLDSVKFWGTFEISGGSGRFEGATGSGDYWGECGTGTGILHFDGLLTR